VLTYNYNNKIMKLIKLKYLIISSLTVLTVVSCGDDFLDVQPNDGRVLESNYYKDETQAFSALVSVYDRLSKYSGTFDNMMTMLNAGSDDFVAGGGGATDGTGIQSFSNYTISSSTLPSNYWNDYYQGVFRANTLLEKLPSIPMDANKRARFTSETKALRGYFYFELVRLFKNIPLITKPVLPSDTYNIRQNSAAEVYAQIEKDLIDAKPDLPLTISSSSNDAGRFTQGSVQALLGKVYLYEGKKTEAAQELAAVNGTPGGTSQYGYKLQTNFADLWLTNNKFNSESIIEISHSPKANVTYNNWGSNENEGNTVNVMVGPRTYNRISSTAPGYVSGFSFNPITQDLYDFIKLDPRFSATVADLKALKLAGQITYAPGYQDTGYFLKKFMPKTSDLSTGGGVDVLNYKQNTYVLRLADTYLMEAEALNGTGTRAQALLDAVRGRVGLTPVPVSINAILNERRLELVGEGHRWYDLVRTGRAATVLASRGFVAGKHEIWPIPLKELENTLIIQNPNY
jgi:starch-binding outer membrane protein, SusD/RagB family